ncbi:YjcZ family sporulation protein, partial [Neobacillus drentensis]
VLFILLIIIGASWIY